MVGEPLEPVSTARRLPRWSEVREVVRFRRPRLGRTARRLEHALTIRDLRTAARRTTPRAVFDYVDGAAEEEITAARNVAAYRRVTFLPDALRSVADPDPGVELLGSRIAMPLVFAPTGYTRMMHHHGEAAVAAVAQHVGVPYALSTVGSTSIEDVRAAAPGADLWFQLFFTARPDVNEDLVSRAEAAGYSTILLTVDTVVSGMRLRDVVNGLTIPPTLTARTVLDMSRFPAWWFNELTTGGLAFASLTGVPGNPTPGEVASMMFDPGLDITALDWLRRRWRGKLLVKGVTTPASAGEVVEHGADGVVVSNHGGRQLDRSAATLDVLPAIRAAVGPEATVLVDGGVLHGQDVVAARALGADAVMIGRAYLYGLMAGGRDGVLRAYDILAAEYQRSMQLLGVRRSEELSARHVAVPPHGAGGCPHVPS
ncbi:alpha-hydroxy-acid oxidizing protein [Geodermatophilus sp. YIM 151500]|uniref:alpha-hydroxy acid oxidase n=1 Tax=Geodermatophilus sp. YIM 151500 TaxID=2984531 RepID=UPI0021E39B22|nr:alpha-hydroxy acid oxidase [Geodermatophilus sp. YIM 151500]MCV2488617.1 alpha-hydroxy-acid oxidizing protein [Geodermatophilus sp. YIM 151500]